MLKWLKNILGIIILAFLIWYLVSHWQDTKVLLKLNVLELVVICFVFLVAVTNNGLVVMAILKPMGIKVFFRDMVLLQNACLLLNYMPMKFGTLFMANYLKRHYGLKFSHFGTFSVYLTLLLSAVASLTGIVAVIFVYGLADAQKQILAGVFLVCLAVSVSLIFIPLPVPKGTSKLSIILRDFLTGRKVVSQDSKALFTAGFFLLFNFVLTSVRLGIIYHSMGINIHPAGYLILGALAYIMIFINITPGALGLREAVLGAGAVALGVPLEVGITAAIIDRAIILSWAFVVGGVCAGWIWHKSPADFKETKEKSFT
jgi:uncharacterized membrane protein YbhN (UPF0104 family)